LSGGSWTSRGRTVAAVLILAAAGPAAGVGPTDIRRVDEFIDAPRALFGRTRAGIEATLGPPVSVEVRRLGQALDPTRTEPIHELRYPGLLLGVRPSAALARVRLTTKGFRLPQGLDIGVARERVEEVLGEAQEMTDGRYLYLYSDGFPDTVEFYFRDGRVHRIEWRYSAP
jgi:hypothetical protein